MKSNLPSLSKELQDRLYEALLSCEEFDSNMHLQELIENGELAVYHRWFLMHEYETKEERVKNTIKYLIRQRLQGITPALPLLLLIIRKDLLEGDALRDELGGLYREIELDLLSFYSTSSYSTITTTAIPSTSHHIHRSSPSNTVEMATIEEVFLAPSDREWIINIVDTIIEPMHPSGRKHLLLACIPPGPHISSIKFDNASRYVAEDMINLIEARDKPNSDLRYLEAFLHHLIKADLREGDDVETKIEILLANYKNQALKRRSLSFPPKHGDHQHNDHHIIYQRLQEVREDFVVNQSTSIYKIDTSAIIQCNLDKQRTHFINGFDGHYKGFFTFAVASIDHDVLKNYVIESLTWELKRRTQRQTDVRHVYLYSEHFNSLSIEQDSFDLQKKLEDYFGIQSFNDLIEDNQDTDLVIVLWNMNIALDDFKHVALRFTDRLKEHTHAILQKRCLVLFWANYGPHPIRPLDVSIALPTFEQFEVDHVVEWLETELSNLQKSEQIPEQAIKYCWNRLVAKVAYHGGNLPGTYESLLEPLELGGYFD